MREFWVASGHHLARRDDAGRLLLSEELVLAYLARPELLPPPEACDAERALHARMLAAPLAEVPAAAVAALADADARENWSLFLGFRDRLIGAPSLERAYLELVRERAGQTPPVFLNQLSQLIARNALDGCDDPFVLRAAELMFRPQQASIRKGVLLLADAELVEARRRDPHVAPLTVLMGREPVDELDVMDEANAWTYWSRSDAHSMVMNLGSSSHARDGLARAMERWIQHLLDVETRIQPLAAIEEKDMRWFVGLDAEATAIGNDMWAGRAIEEARAARLLAMFRLEIIDQQRVEPKLRGAPVYLLLAADASMMLRMKPQNLIVGLPLLTAG